MADDLTTLKRKRSSTKRSVMIKLKKMKHHINVGIDFDSITNMFNDMNALYDNLYDLHFQCIDVMDSEAKSSEIDYLTSIDEDFHFILTKVREIKEMHTIKTMESTVDDVTKSADNIETSLSKLSGYRQTELLRSLSYDIQRISLLRNNLREQNKYLISLSTDRTPKEAEVKVVIDRAEDVFKRATIALQEFSGPESATLPTPQSQSESLVSTAIALEGPSGENQPQGKYQTSLAAFTGDAPITTNSVPELSSDFVPANRPKDEEKTDAFPAITQTQSVPYAHAMFPGIVQTKRPELPTFSGDRTDWPEFKCVWTSLAESQFRNRLQLAIELKRACAQGRAAQSLRHIYATSDRAYDEMWSRLKDEYDDPGLSVQASIRRLSNLRPLHDQDFKGLVKLVDTVEGVANQLHELQQTHAMNMVDVDRVCAALPKSIQRDWLRRYQSLEQEVKIKPFPAFVKFLKEERSTVARLVEYDQLPYRQEKQKSYDRHGSFRSKESHHIQNDTVRLKDAGTNKQQVSCVLHDNSTHQTSDCRKFKELPVSKKYDALKRHMHCFKCLKRHKKDACKAPACECGRNHHKILCRDIVTDGTNAQQDIAKQKSNNIPVSTSLVNTGNIALYPIHTARVAGNQAITVFMDGGSNASYITEKCAARNSFNKKGKVTLDISTVGGNKTEFRTTIYEVPLRTIDGKIVNVSAYGLPEITGKLSNFHRNALEKLFPDHDPNALMRSSQTVDLLIGTDYFGLHPKIEVARAGPHLSIMKGDLGICLVGTHPLLKENTHYTPKNLHVSETQTYFANIRSIQHIAFTKPQSFFQGEELGTSSSPKCGGCKCGSCPMPGHDLSFKEEQELEMIRSNLKYDVDGIQCNPIADTISNPISLNFPKKQQGQKLSPDITENDFPNCVPETLTKRQVLQQVMSIYDPMGLASPFTLIGKINLRDSWILKLDWDDPLPPSLYSKWLAFFKSLFQLEKFQLPRCLRPDDPIGNPWLIILSDGSDIAYGCAAYVRWTCADGSIRMRLIMAKSRIAPINKVSTPRMELNAAVVSKRCRSMIEKEMRYKFDRTLHLVDSETVLNMINKVSTRFKIYEGVRIGEIQAASNGDMSEWAWIPGVENISDWLTRGKYPEELHQDSDWFNGPKMLYKPFQDWDIKFGKTCDDISPGEKRNVQMHAIASESIEPTIMNYDNVNSFKKAVRIIARIIGIKQARSFRGGHVDEITTHALKQSEEFILNEAQKHLDMNHGDYKRLNPSRNTQGLWIIGASRLRLGNPMSPIHATLPIFIPKSHPIARLAMTDAHEQGHRGRDATLAMFRNKFWTPRGSSLAKRIRDTCQLCRLRDAKMMEHEMGNLPIERLTPSPPFNNVMIDLFGPYAIRGEVQKRTSGKAWCVIFSDLYSRAIHIEATYGYDSSHFLLALSRFASLRGWPNKIYSDPGTQLIGANKEINEAARRKGIQHGMQWVVGPADSPWRQGAVEALIKSAKRALHLAIQGQRLTAEEFLTVCTEAANTVNERPIGLLPSLDSEINVLTPNCLLLGRATSANPGGWQPEGPPTKSRYNLVSMVGNQFWNHWVQSFAPTLVYQTKWFSKGRNLQIGDVVLVADTNTLRGNYRIAKVTQVHPSKDGKIRTATVSYKNFKVGESVKEYKGSKDVFVKRSAQRLVLLVAVEDI